MHNHCLFLLREARKEKLFYPWICLIPDEPFWEMLLSRIHTKERTLKKKGRTISLKSGSKVNHRANAHLSPFVTAFTPCGFSLPEVNATILPHLGFTFAWRGGGPNQCPTTSNFMLTSLQKNKNKTNTKNNNHTHTHTQKITYKLLWGQLI